MKKEQKEQSDDFLHHCHNVAFFITAHKSLCILYTVLSALKNIHLLQVHKEDHAVPKHLSYALILYCKGKQYTCTLKLDTQKVM